MPQHALLITGRIRQQTLNITELIESNKICRFTGLIAGKQKQFFLFFIFLIGRKQKQFKFEKVTLIIVS